MNLSEFMELFAYPEEIREGRPARCVRVLEKRNRLMASPFSATMRRARSLSSAVRDSSTCVGTDLPMGKRPLSRGAGRGVFWACARVRRDAQLRANARVAEPDGGGVVEKA